MGTDPPCADCDSRPTAHYRRPDRPLTPYNTGMNKTNPYVAQILSQGKEPSKAPAPKREFPCTIHGRTYETEQEYLQDLHDFLNGM